MKLVWRLLTKTFFHSCLFGRINKKLFIFPSFMRGRIKKYVIFAPVVWGTESETTYFLSRWEKKILYFSGQLKKRKETIFQAMTG